MINAARDLGAQELVMGASNVYSADEQIEQIAFYWFNLHDGTPQPLTIRILGPNRDLYFDLAGGNRIPKLGERRARSVAELREAGVGISHVLLVHDGTSVGSDLFADVLTMLDPLVALTVVPLPSRGGRIARGRCRDRLARAGPAAGQAVAPRGNVPANCRPASLPCRWPRWRSNSIAT